MRESKHFQGLFFALVLLANVAAADVPVADVDSLSPLPVDEMPNSAWFSATLTRKEIENSGAKSIPEVLRLLPGMIYTSPWGSYKMASYRGMTDEFPRRTRFEVDGVPINVAATGGVEWNAIPVRLEDIDKIVLVTNPSSALNGNGAYNGVVKIFTVKPDQSSNMVSLMGGTGAYRDFYARGAFSASDALSFQLTASKQASDGDHQRVSDEDLNRLWGSVLYAPNYENQMTLNLGIGRANTDTTSAADDPKAASYRNRSMTNIQGNLNWVNRSVGETTVVLGFNDIHNDAINLIENDQLIFDISYKSNRKFASVQHREILVPGLELSAGADYTQDDEIPQNWSATESEWHSSESSGNIALKYDVQRLSFGAGMNVTKHSAYHDAAYNKFASLDVQLAESQKLGLLYSEGVRFLTNWESRASLYTHLTADSTRTQKLFLYGSSPAFIKPERVESWSLKYSLVKQRNNFSLRLFQDSYTDISYFTYTACPSGALCAYTNGTEVIGNGSGDAMRVQGAEVFANWPLNRHHQLVASYTNSHVETNSNNNLIRTYSTPEHILSLMTSSTFGKTKFNLIYNYFSDIRWESVDNSEAADKTLKGYANISVNVQRCMDVGTYDALCLQASAENLLEEDSTFYELPNSKTARNYYLKLDYRF